MIAGTMASLLLFTSMENVGVQGVSLPVLSPMSALAHQYSPSTVAQYASQPVTNLVDIGGSSWANPVTPLLVQ